LSNYSQPIVSVFCQAIRGEISPFFGRLTVSIRDIMSSSSPSIIALVAVNYLNTFPGVSRQLSRYYVDFSRWIFSIFCQKSEGKLPRHFHLTVKILYTFCRMPHGKLSRYFVRRLTVNSRYFIRCKIHPRQAMNGSINIAVLFL
jgi:hypothetical protein